METTTTTRPCARCRKNEASHETGLCFQCWQAARHEGFTNSVQKEMLTEAPIVNEKSADNGEHSHYELIDVSTGNVLWSEGKE